MTDHAPLISPSGQVRFGRFDHTLPRINGRDADYRTPMGRPASRWARHFHYKQFQYFGLIGKDLMAGCAMADTAYLGLVFVYVFRPSTGQLQEYTWRAPLGRGLSLSDSPTEGHSHFRQGQVLVSQTYHSERTGRRRTLQVQAPGLELQATLHEGPGYRPMSLCTRTGINGWVYANKVAGVPVTGHGVIQGQHLDLEALDAFGHHDFSAGYMRRETFWNWACLSGVSQGHRIGLNLSCGVNETSHTESCFWVDDQLIVTGPAVFEYDRDRLLQPWRIHTGCGQVRLDFQPLGAHRERLDLGLFASNFHQLFGRFSGWMQHPDGRCLPLELYGFVEEQYAKW